MPEYESEITDSQTLSTITKAEMDQQITTAKAYPRSVQDFKNEANELATMSEEVAEECFYVLPARGQSKKQIIGPSARFAEIIMSCWGNCRSGARIVAEEREFIVAQGVFHDLQRNVSITYEVKRRITKKDGGRYGTDMIGVTGNAACSIALRNAVFKGIPKAFWISVYNNALAAAKGDIKTVTQRRAVMMKHLEDNSVEPQQVMDTLGIKGIEDIGIEELFTLKGILNAIREGDTSYREAFSENLQDTNLTKETGDLNTKLEKQVATKTTNKIDLIAQIKKAGNVNLLLGLEALILDLPDKDRIACKKAVTKRRGELTEPAE